MKFFTLEFLIVLSNIGAALVVSSLLVIVFNEPKIIEAVRLMLGGIITILSSLAVRAILKKGELK